MLRVWSMRPTFEEQADRAAAAGQFGAARSLLEKAVQADSSSADLWTKLSAMRKASGDLKGALAALDRGLALNPLDFSSLLYRAMILDALADPTAGEAFGHALTQAPPEDQIPEPMKPAVAQARKRNEEYRTSLEHFLAQNIPPDLSPAEQTRAERFVSNRSRKTRHYHQGPSDFHYPGMPEIEFHDRELFPGLQRSSKRQTAIRAEFDALIAAEAAEMVPYVQYPDARAVAAMEGTQQ